MTDLIVTNHFLRLVKSVMCQYHFAIVLFLVSTVNACDENYTTSVPSLRIVDGYRCLPEDYPYLVSLSTFLKVLNFQFNKFS